MDTILPSDLSRPSLHAPLRDSVRDREFFEFLSENKLLLFNPMFLLMEVHHFHRRRLHRARHAHRVAGMALHPGVICIVPKTFML